MKVFRKIYALLILGIPLLPHAHAEKLLVSDEAPDTSFVITIVAAYQMEDEIWITSDMEQARASALCMVSYPIDWVEASLPSIVAKHVGDLFLIGSKRPLFLHREQINEFDFEAGDGWVDTEVAGWLYIREYPWVFEPELGWLLTVEGEATDRLGPIPGKYSRHFGIAKLAFYFYSSEFGWLWKSPYSELYYVFDRNVWLTSSQITGG